MLDTLETIQTMGEKRIIKEIIKPLLNPLNKANLAGDDCAILSTENKEYISTSTDRVPADLLSFKLGLINYRELGEYLATLNISDIYSSGAKPKGLLLNLAFPNNFLIDDLKAIIEGAQFICRKYDCQVIGGDLSHSTEMSLSATALGLADSKNIIYRSGAKNGDYIYCTKEVGLTPTAFEYFLNAKPKGLILSSEEEDVLINQFRNLELNSELIESIIHLNIDVCGMDNTDGVAQSLYELSEINDLAYCLHKEKIKYNPISKKVADFLKMNLYDLILGSGADFQLLGTISKENYSKYIDNSINKDLFIIGECTEGQSGIYIKNTNNKIEKFQVKGWEYFKED